MVGYNTDTQNQISELSRVLMLNHELYGIIEAAAGLGLQNHYIGAGCIAQTVWNYQLGLDLSFGISDVDFVYYDDSDISSDAESEVANKLRLMIPQCKFELDVNNQARVHLWYKDYFGYDMQPYTSVEAAINTWPTTATSVGVRLEGGALKVYAPYGLNDIFGLVVRANKTQITEEVYIKKVSKWTAKWPSLNVVPW